MYLILLLRLNLFYGHVMHILQMNSEPSSPLLLFSNDTLLKSNSHAHKNVGTATVWINFLTFSILVILSTLSSPSRIPNDRSPNQNSVAPYTSAFHHPSYERSPWHTPLLHYPNTALHA